MDLNAIQKFLNIPLTETLDEFTEAAIRNFQVKCELDVTGQPDQQTIDRINQWNDGKIDTDFSVNGQIKQYYLRPDEYFTTTEPKRSIFLHHTAGWNNPRAVVNDWERDTRGRIGTAFVIGGVNPVTTDNRYDGEVVECFPYKTGYAWHLGIGNTSTHRNSVGVELCNFGYLVKNDKSQYVTYTGAIVDPKNVTYLTKPFRGYSFFQRYMDAQIVNLRDLIIRIGKETGIDITLGLQKRIKNFKDVYKALDYDPAIVKGQDGLFCHTNVSGPNRFGGYEKFDIFPQDEIISMIKSL